jgi:hypothetical protein
MNGRWPGIGIARSAGSTPWTPADEPTVTAWFDETHASSITLSSGSVSQWTSRVGTGVLSQGTQAQMPTKETGWLRFVGQALLFAVQPSVGASFSVLRPAPVVGGRVWGSVLISSGVEPLSIGYDETDVAYTYEVVPSVPTFRQDGSPIVPSPNWGANAPPQSPRIPVASFGDPVLVGIDYPTDRPFSNIGSINASPSGAAHLQAQVILLSGSPSTLIFQKLEGWAAHKYGVASKLPAGHPYKAAPPTL